MKLKITYIVLLSLLTVFFSIYILYKDSGTETVFLKSRLVFLENESQLQSGIIGRSLGTISPAKTNKIVFALFDSTGRSSNMERELETAMEFYLELKHTSKAMQNTSFVYWGNKIDTSLAHYLVNTYKKRGNFHINITESQKEISLLRKGSAVMLLNKDNVCLYAYSLQKDNYRINFEKHAIMVNLLTNIK